MTTTQQPGRVDVFVRSVWALALVALTSALAPAPLAAQTGTIGLNFTGVTLNNGISLKGFAYSPPDNAGAVGSTQVVQLINGAFAVYDKSTGARTELISDQKFWHDAGYDPGPGLSTFNARIVFDPTVNRWIAAELTGEDTSNNVLLARSDTADAMGSWKAISFPGSLPESPQFVDFTMMGVDAHGIYLTTSNFASRSNGGQGLYSAFSIPKADLLASTPTADNVSRFDDLADQWAHPITDFGPAKNHAPLLSSSAAANANLLYRSDIIGGEAAGATLSFPSTHIPVNTYSGPPAAAQPDGTRSISTIDDRFTASVYEVGHIIYAVRAVQVLDSLGHPHSGIDWLKIDETNNHVIQEGTISDADHFDYFFPSINANANGDVVIGFTRSGLGAGGNLSDYAVVGHTLLSSTTFGNPFLLKASSVGNYHLINDRWGDYTSTIVDPSNPNVFWTFQEYALDSTTWATQITQINVPEPGSVVLAGLALAGLSIAAWRRHQARPSGSETTSASPKSVARRVPGALLPRRT